MGGNDVEYTDADIAYQNKDIFSKFMGGRMRNKSFKAYGLDLPEIVRVEPTNLPTIQATKPRITICSSLPTGRSPSSITKATTTRRIS